MIDIIYIKGSLHVNISIKQLKWQQISFKINVILFLYIKK